jgi:hypothetical protein
VALNGSLGSTESQTDILVPSPGLTDLLALRLGLSVEEDVRLLLERTFRLDGQLGSHFCENSGRRGSEVELDIKFVAKGGVGSGRWSTSMLRKIYSTMARYSVV